MQWVKLHRPCSTYPIEAIARLRVNLLLACNHTAVVNIKCVYSFSSGLCFYDNGRESACAAITKATQATAKAGGSSKPNSIRLANLFPIVFMEFPPPLLNATTAAGTSRWCEMSPHILSTCDVRTCVSRVRAFRTYVQGRQCRFFQKCFSSKCRPCAKAPFPLK